MTTHAAIADRIAVANQVLSYFAETPTILLRANNRVQVRWTTRTKSHTKSWMTRGQDFYPVWHRDWPGGGTAQTALSQLVRWVQGKPVLPLDSWRYWASEKVKLLRDTTALDILSGAGYPDPSHCVLCDRPLTEGLDWWRLDGVSGPCCGWTSGCRQQPEKLEQCAT